MKKRFLRSSVWNVPLVLALAGCLTAVASAPSVSDPGRVTVVSQTSPDGKRSQREVPQGSILLQAAGPRGAAEARLFAPDAPIRLIVQFDAPPIARARREGIPLEVCRAPMQSFVQALPAIQSRLAGRGLRAAGSVRVTRRLETSFNGVAVEGPPELAAELRALSYVSGVFPDDTVRATLQQSVSLIEADQVRETYGAWGEGIEVAILDTGIDYTHPALGGCFGPECRVTHGFNFIRMDADPMDDSGHGTHVAGIVGASGSLVGVAPRVRLHAYKVLDQWGYGYESTVILGVDRALDPDSNPSTQDAVDVINLSLGGGGDADSPLSQAVDEAVAAGVVVVAAAGNGGDHFRVGSPGASREAITVGASTKWRSLASFSSRGPSAPDWDIKPDLVAPGQDIQSTWPGSQSRTLSGTSMATPHVAGAAALLRQIHPTWPPAWIKAALMNTASDIQEGPFAQAAGLIRTLEAARPELLMLPGSLSFGRVPNQLTSWEGQKRLRLFNPSTTGRVVQLAVEGALPLGASVTVAPATLSIAAGDSAEALVTLRVESSLAYPSAKPFAYSGHVVARYDQRQSRVPLAFLKSGELHITCDRYDSFTWLHDRAGNWSLQGAEARILVHPGTYDVMAAIGADLRVFREGIAVTDHSLVEIKQDEAVHTLRQVAIKETGEPLSDALGFEVFRHVPSGISLILILLTRDTERFSTMTEDYSWEFVRYSLSPPDHTYTFHSTRRGVHSSATFQNTPQELRHVTTRLHLPPGVTQTAPKHFMCNGPMGFRGNGEVLGISTYSTLDPPATEQTPLHSYFLDSPAEFHFGAWYKDVESHGDLSQLYLATPYMKAYAGQPTRGYVLGDSEPIVTLAGERYEIGHGPPTWFGRFENSPDSLRLRASRGLTSWIFPLQGNVWTNAWALPYSISRGPLPVLTSTLYGLGGYFGERDARWGVLAGEHTFEIQNDRYFVDGEPGIARAIASFDSRSLDSNPPYLTSMSILADGAVTDVAGAQTTNEVRFEMRDDSELSTVKVYHRLSSERPWVETKVVPQPWGFRARLPDSTGFLSLKLEGTDTSGNRLTYRMEPAVHLTSAVPIASIVANTIVEGTSVSLSWHVPSHLYHQAVVYRTEDGESWAHMGTPGLASGAFLFDDRGVELEHRYGYRLGLIRDGLERLTTITWVDIPGNVLSFAGALANPSWGAPLVRFTLPDHRPAILEVMDVTGRRVQSVVLGSLGPGAHRFDLGGRGAWRPGIYFLRLRHPDGVLTRRVCVLR